MTRSGAGLVDLVCGPDSPLPEARQRYRLLSHLGSGGQADVYRGVRLSAGVSSSPVTVKVFRADARRELLAQLRSWDKGDAVLMDLNSRGVSGICLRVDGFYGGPPAAPDSRDRGEQRIPYQVLDFLPGSTLLQHVGAGTTPRLSGVRVLGALAATLAELHQPADGSDSPVLHMDVKPSNVMVLPDGTVRLIDFTAARYFDAGHLTTIAHTPESGGPEAFSGRVGPSYDVHGFGSVAYFLVTGWLPRAERATPPRLGEVPAPSSLRRHPLLDRHPALASHLLAPLADHPGDRPRTDELRRWVVTLDGLAARLGGERSLVDWEEQSGNRPAVPSPTRVAPAFTTPAPAAPPPPDGSRGAPAKRTFQGVASVPRPQPPPTPPWAPAGYPPPQAGPPGWGAPRWQNGPQHGPPAPLRRRGRGWTRFAAVVAVICWLLWVGAEAFARQPRFATPLTALALLAGGAVAVYWLTVLGGHLIRTTLDQGPRRGTLVPNLLTAVFLAAGAVGFFGRARANAHNVTDWFTDWTNSLWPF